MKLPTSSEEVAESKLAQIFIVMNDKTFGRREAETIVGGYSRLLRLIGAGKIRAEKRSSAQSGKWYCNAADVLRYASVSYQKPRKTKSNDKNNHKRVSA